MTGGIVIKVLAEISCISAGNFSCSDVSFVLNGKSCCIVTGCSCKVGSGCPGVGCCIVLPEIILQDIAVIATCTNIAYSSNCKSYCGTSETSAKSAFCVHVLVVTSYCHMSCVAPLVPIPVPTYTFPFAAKPTALCLFHPERLP